MIKLQCKSKQNINAAHFFSENIFPNRISTTIKPPLNYNFFQFLRPVFTTFSILRHLLHIHQQTFQVLPFRMIDANRMVRALRKTPYNADIAVRVGGGSEEHRLEIVAADRLGAGEGKEQPAGSYLLQRPMVDIFVTLQPLLQAAMVLGKGRRIKHHNVKRLLQPRKVLQRILRHTAMRWVRKVHRHIRVALLDCLF